MRIAITVLTLVVSDELAWIQGKQQHSCQQLQLFLYLSGTLESSICFVIAFVLLTVFSPRTHLATPSHAQQTLSHNEPLRTQFEKLYHVLSIHVGAAIVEKWTKMWNQREWERKRDGEDEGERRTSRRKGWNTLTGRRKAHMSESSPPSCCFPLDVKKWRSN